MRAPSPSIGESIALMSVFSVFSVALSCVVMAAAGGGASMPCCLSLYSARRTSRRIAPEAPASISASIAAAAGSAIIPSARAIARSVTPGLPLRSRSFAIASAGAAAGSKPASISLVSSGFVSCDLLNWMPMRSRGSLCARFPNCQVFHAGEVAINEKPGSKVPLSRITPRLKRARRRSDTRSARYSISATPFSASRMAS